MTIHLSPNDPMFKDRSDYERAEYKLKLHQIKESLKAIYRIMEMQLYDTRLCPDCHNSIKVEHDKIYENGLRALNMISGMIKSI